MITKKRVIDGHFEVTVFEFHRTIIYCSPSILTPWVQSPMERIEKNRQWCGNFELVEGVPCKEFHSSLQWSLELLICFPVTFAHQIRFSGIFTPTIVGHLCLQFLFVIVFRVHHSCLMFPNKQLKLDARELVRSIRQANVSVIECGAISSFKSALLI